MATNKEYLEYALFAMREIEGISYKPMMGEYLLYKDGILFGGLYDNRFLLKKTKSVTPLGLGEALPYKGAKMILEIDPDDTNLLKTAILAVVEDLNDRK